MVTISKGAYTFLNEPDVAIYREKGLMCAALRSFSGNWCGYVGLPKTHPYYGLSHNSKVVVSDLESVPFNNNWIGALTSDPNEASLGIIRLDMALQCHSGVTYCGQQVGYIGREIFPDTWWIGFDTGHSGDLHVFDYSLGGKYLNISDIFGEGVVYRDLKYVRNEIAGLAKQLAEMMPTPAVVKKTTGAKLLRRTIRKART